VIHIKHWVLDEKRDNEGKVYAESWKYKNGIFYAVVVKGHIHYPKNFVIHCPMFGWDTVCLKSITAEGAKTEAAQLIQSEAKILFNIFEKLI
jgi:hypothetical protein